MGVQHQAADREHDIHASGQTTEQDVGVPVGHQVQFVPQCIAAQLNLLTHLIGDDRGSVREVDDRSHRGQRNS
ncbi:hypothetical protein D3C83_231340 [compost metagenome]